MSRPRKETAASFQETAACLLSADGHPISYLAGARVCEHDVYAVVAAKVSFCFPRCCTSVDAFLYEDGKKRKNHTRKSGVKV